MDGNSATLTAASNSSHHAQGAGHSSNNENGRGPPHLHSATQPNPTLTPPLPARLTVGAAGMLLIVLLHLLGVLLSVLLRFPLYASCASAFAWYAASCAPEFAWYAASCAFAFAWYVASCASAVFPDVFDFVHLRPLALTCVFHPVPPVALVCTY
eukprot:scaffold184408_cov22-Tisochrysis_lutea.AAC.1